MIWFFPLAAAFATAVGLVYDKVILSRFKLDYRVFTVFLFFFLFLVTIPVALWWGRADVAIFQPVYLIFLFLVVFLAVIWNLLLYRAVASEKLVEVELIFMSTPLVIVLLAALFLPAERDLKIFLPAIFATLALLWAHLKKHHLDFSKQQKGLLIAIVLIGLETILVKKLLAVYSPPLLYLARSGLIFLILLLFLRAPKWKIKPRATWGIFKVAIVGMAQMILTYFGYQLAGVSLTTLILVLAPVLIYLFSVVFLKEKLTPKHIVSFVIILASIIYATALN
ncbi:DMT family transporter [Candidatus Berkelbacteria bacterium]|nr:DMT family transporter [Candidatus Berkelbacteria bacterium]